MAVEENMRTGFENMRTGFHTSTHAFRGGVVPIDLGRSVTALEDASSQVTNRWRPLPQQLVRVDGLSGDRGYAMVGYVVCMTWEYCKLPRKTCSGSCWCSTQVNPPSGSGSAPKSSKS